MYYDIIKITFKIEYIVHLSDIHIPININKKIFKPVFLLFYK